MNRLDKSTVGKRVESPIYNQMWVIQLSHCSAGKCRVVLHLCALPYGVSKMETQIVINYNNINFKQNTKLITFSYSKPATYFDIICTFNEFREYDTFEINIELLILKQYDNNNSEIQDIAAREWNQYIDDKKDNINFSMDINGNKNKIKEYIDNKFIIYDSKLNLLSNDIQQLIMKK
eukprot:29234_1